MGRRDEYGQVVEQRAVGLAVGNWRLSVSEVISWLLAAGLGLVDRYGRCLPAFGGGGYGQIVEQRAVGVQQLTIEVKLLDIGKWVLGC